MVKTTLFDYSNCSGIRILRNFMNESCAGQVKIVGDRLHCLQVARQANQVFWLISKTVNCLYFLNQMFKTFAA